MYTGYNALSMALSMPENGRVVACETEETYINISKPFFTEVRDDLKHIFFLSFFFYIGVNDAVEIWSFNDSFTLKSLILVALYSLYNIQSWTGWPRLIFAYVKAGLQRRRQAVPLPICLRDMQPAQQQKKSVWSGGIKRATKMQSKAIKSITDFFLTYKKTRRNKTQLKQGGEQKKLMQYSLIYTLSSLQAGVEDRIDIKHQRAMITLGKRSFHQQ